MDDPARPIEADEEIELLADDSITPLVGEGEPLSANDAGPDAHAPRRPRLGELLIEAGLVDGAQLEAALRYQRVHGGRLGSALIALGLVSEAQLQEKLGQQLGLEVCEVESIAVSPEALRLVPEALIRKHEAVPIELRGRTLVLATPNPRALASLDEVRFAAGAREVEARLITETTYRRLIATCFPSPVLGGDIAASRQLVEQAQRSMEGLSIDAFAGDVAGLAAGHADGTLPSVVHLVDHLIAQATKVRASDIHFEPYDKFFRVRYRVDGVLYTVMTPPKVLQTPMVSRIKVLAALDISERRKPQDGHMVFRNGPDEVHLRISTLPTVFGEKCVVRVLKREAHLADIHQLGFRPDQLEEAKRVAQLSQGLVLVTGPTGSGKTTTLHAFVNYINEPDVNIVTIEDPVEVAIPGVNHVQTLERGGLTFASALRSILRQDPDVILVGEVRDADDARTAVQASLSGHLVLTTLHTNGVLPTFLRLSDLNVEPFMLAESLALVLSQRLLRRVCNRCAKTESLPKEVAGVFGVTREQQQTAVFKVPVGCEACLHTGYRGQVAVYESLVPDEHFRKALFNGASRDDLYAAVTSLQVTWMWDAGVARALAGETTFDEVRRVLVPFP